MTTTQPDTALLLMDLQASMLDRMGSPELIAALTTASDAAREAGIPVIYARIGFRPGHPEVSPNNRAFSGLAANGGFVEGDAMGEIPAPLTPRDGDVVVTKKRVSAFSGSGLEQILRSRGITNLVLTGLATSGVVLSTYIEAADQDFGLTVLRDCCGDGAPELESALLDQLFPRGADVVTASEWAAGLGA